MLWRFARLASENATRGALRGTFAGIIDWSRGGLTTGSDHCCARHLSGPLSRQLTGSPARPPVQRAIRARDNGQAHLVLLEGVGGVLQGVGNIAQGKRSWLAQKQSHDGSQARRAPLSGPQAPDAPLHDSTRTRKHDGRETGPRRGGPVVGFATQGRRPEADARLTTRGLMAPPMSLTRLVDIARRPVTAEATRTDAERAAAAMATGKLEGEVRLRALASSSVQRSSLRCFVDRTQSRGTLLQRQSHALRHLRAGEGCPPPQGRGRRRSRPTCAAICLVAVPMRQLPRPGWRSTP